MPLIHELICDQCEHDLGASGVITYVILEDGTEEICPHPCEFMVAEQVTGIKWTELRRNGRFIYRYPLVCLSCGDLDFYGPHDLNIAMPPQSHVGNIVSGLTRSAAGLYECRSCGQKNLEPLARYTGFIRTILSWAGNKRLLLDCKNCGEGKYIPMPGTIS